MSQRMDEGNRVDGRDRLDGASRALHLIGIGGSGLCSLAAYLLQRGDTVSGCDQKESSILRLLREHGAQIDLGHDAEHVVSHGSIACDELVFTAAAKDDHPELAAARAHAVTASKYAQFLGRETRGKRCVAVAGTHGKTTTTALVTELLVGGGLDPSAVVGGFPLGWELPGRAGRGDTFVVEACEYDRSFLNFSPHVAVITNVEPDHLDYFGSAEKVFAAFAEFAGRVDRSGAIVVHESALHALGSIGTGESGPERIVVGTSAECDVRIVRTGSAGGCPRGRIELRDGRSIELALAVPGEHNLVDAALAAAAALRLGVAPETIEPSIARFLGVRRRLEHVGTRDGVRYVSDYAHHPTEIRAVRLALRERDPDRRLIVVFQPHQASRTRDFRSDFARELAAFDEVIVPNIFSVREDREGVERETVQLVDAIRDSGRAAHRADGLDGVFAEVASIARPGDVAILMGAGDIDDLAEELRRAPATPRLAREAGVA